MAESTVMDESPPIFQFRDSTGQMREANDGPLPYPRKIVEYTVDPNKWPTLPLDQREPHHILTTGTEAHICMMCNKTSLTGCPRQTCVDEFDAAMSDYGERVTEVRAAGWMGKGVFATEDIDEATWLGEYLGEIVPATYPLTDDESSYTFDVDGRYAVNARHMRNWTAYMNHHCDENVEPAIFIYAGRYVMGLRTRRLIKKDEQLFTWYDRDYFERRGIQCLCDNEEGAHLPPLPAASNPAPSTPANPAPAGEAPAPNTAVGSEMFGNEVNWDNDEIRIRLRLTVV